jgi:hypothetical protein
MVLRRTKNCICIHTTDIKPHPNGNAVQRRDIIGTNGGKSDFWKRVLEDYKTRQVVFDAKNFEELGPSEYDNYNHI